MSRSLLQQAGILILSGLVYSQTLFFDFVWDDYNLIVNNPVLKQERPWLQFFADLNNQVLTYRPVSFLSFSLDYRIWGLTPFGYHLTNVLLHIAVTFLLLRLVEYLTGSFRAATAAAVVFGLHPVHTEAVAWIVGRTDLWAAFFTLLSLRLYLKSFSETGLRSGFWAAGAWVGFILALLSKETAIILPLLLAICAVQVKPKNRLSVVMNFLLMGAAVFLYLGLRAPLLAEHAAFAFSEAFFTAVFLIGEYIRLLIFPVFLKPLYQLPVLSFGDPVVLRSLIIGATGLIVLGYAFFKKESAVFAGMAWVLAALAPAFALVLYQTLSPMAERLLYLPSVGFALACGALWVRATDALGARFSRFPWLVPVIPALLIIPAAFTTMQSNAVWAGDEALWTHAAAQTPRNAVAHRNLATYYLEQRQLQKAIEHYGRALSLKADDVDSHYNTGIAYLDQGSLDPAIEHFREAIKWRPDHSNAYTNMAYAYHLQGRDDLALGAIREALRTHPSNAVAHNSLGNLLAAQGLWQTAAEHYRTALTLQPDYREAGKNLEEAVRRGSEAR